MTPLFLCPLNPTPNQWPGESLGSCFGVIPTTYSNSTRHLLKAPLSGRIELRVNVALYVPPKPWISFPHPFEGFYITIAISRATVELGQA